MKTLVELFDKEPVENVYSSMAFNPNRVVYIGEKRLMTVEKQEHVRRFFRQKKPSTELYFYQIRTDDMTQIETVFDEIIHRFDHCICDVTGGTDLLLVSAGMLCARKKIPLLFFNIHTGEFVNIYGCEALAGNFQIPALTVENLMALAGGSFIRHGHYSPELELPENRKIIENVWDIIKEDIPRWGRQASYFQQAAKGNDEKNKNALFIHAPIHIQANFKNIVHCDPYFMNRLSAAGAIHSYRMENNRVHYAYKNLLFKRLLSDAGVWLELYTYYTAQRTGFFDDLKTSVIIDWDGKIDPVGTINEVDDILIKGITSLFISCKIGIPSVMAINEIHTLTRQFGGSMAKPVLVTASPLREIPEATRLRAADMGVSLLEAGKLSRREFSHALIKLTDISENYFKRQL